jgi:hypothetical protein
MERSFIFENSWLKENNFQTIAKSTATKLQVNPSMPELIILQVQSRYGAKKTLHEELNCLEEQIKTSP